MFYVLYSSIMNNEITSITTLTGQGDTFPSRYSSPSAGKRRNTMRQIGDSFHFKGYIWEIVDRFQGGYALQRTTKNTLYDYNGWVTENYTVFDINPHQPEVIKRPRFKTCHHCGDKWEGSHCCRVLNTPEQIKARQQQSY